MQMYKRFRLMMKDNGLKRSDRKIVIREIQAKYEPLMQEAEMKGKTLCPERLRLLPIVTPLLEAYGFEFKKEGKQLFLYKTK